jgi:hypothetical protein
MKRLKIGTIVVALSLSVTGSVHASGSTLHSKTYPILFPDSKFEFKTQNFMVKQDLYEGVIHNVRSMLTERVGVADLIGGSIKVTDQSKVLDKIDEYLDIVNKQMNRKVTFNIKIYKVICDEGKVLDNSWVIKKGAISDLDKTSGFLLISSQDTITSNYNPLPITLLREQSYIPQTSIVNKKDGSVTFTDNNITSGVNLTVLPKISNKEDKVQLDIYGSVSIVEISKSGIDGVSIELPKSNIRLFSQTFKLNDGESVIWKSVYKTNDSYGYIIVITPKDFTA